MVECSGGDNMKTDNNDAKKAIMQFLSGQGASVADAARLVGMSRQRLYYILSGDIKISQAERVAAAFGYRVRLVFDPVPDGDNSSEKQTVKNC